MKGKSAMKIIEFNTSESVFGMIKITFNEQIKLLEATRFILNLYKIASGDTTAMLADPQICEGLKISSKAWARHISSGDKTLLEVISLSSLQNNVFWLNSDSRRIKSILVKAFKDAKIVRTK